MSHKYPREALGDVGEEHKASSVPSRSRQPNGTAAGEPPVRRSWRPCQMLNQDGELDPHHHHHHHHHQTPHHHHPPTARGPPRQRRRPPSGQSQSQGLVPVLVPSRQEQGEVPDMEPCPIQQPRPGVARYRRQGDPRVRVPRQRQPIREIQDASLPLQQSHNTDQREGPAEVHSSHAPVTDQSQDRGSPVLQTPVAVVTPTQLIPDPPNPEDQHTLSPRVEEVLQEMKEEDKEEEEKEEGKEQQEEDCHSECMSRDYIQTVNDGVEEHAERVEEVQEEQEVMDDAIEDNVARGAEIGDLCSDTESTASLSMDGPLHSPPPLQSPTPPSSPEMPPFPQLDQFSEEPSASPTPNSDPLAEEDEGCSESCLLSHSTSYTESYPKTYADFYTESHQKSYPKPLCESYSEPYTKSYPNSFPEPLDTSYPELHREPRRRSGRRPEPSEDHQESYQEPYSSHRQVNVQKGAPTSPTEYVSYPPRQSRDRSSHQTPACQDRSVGCRLHHYDGQSDGEGDTDTDGSPSPTSSCKSLGLAPRYTHTETQVKSPSSGRSSSGEVQEEQDTTGLPGEEGAKGSGDAISLAIKDIKEAIEEVKTKTVRSPYTPDQPVEPVWVMRQEVITPAEDGCPQQTMACHSVPESPSQSVSESPSHYTSVPVREAVSPVRAESSRAYHQHYHQQHQHNQHHQGRQSQQRDTARPPQSYAQPQPHVYMLSNQHQLQQHQHQHPPPQPPRPQPQVHPQSPPLPQQPSAQEIRRSLPSFPTYVEVPGPCDPEDLIDGIIFAASYLGSTHLLSERTPTKSARMQQAQEAMSRVRAAQKQAKNRKKSPDGEAPSTAEVDLFMSTQRIKVLSADTQESIMDMPLRTISYIADIGNMVVLMARGKMVRSRSAQDNLDNTAEQATMTNDDRRLYRMICHVFESEDAQLIAQSIGQSFSVAYQEFLRANGIDPEDLSQREYSDLLNTQDMYNDDLIHFSKSENCKDVYIEKQKGEILGVVIVESGWGSILPTVIIASMMHAGPAEKSGRLNIGDQIMTINGTSLVGLPLNTCQSIIKGLKSQSRIKLNIVRCPPVTMVLIRRPDLRYQLGFSVQNGIICSLMRGGIAERGGVRVGHRIIEINSQSVVATPHEKIVQILSNAMGEIHMKTMPAAMYRLLTAQEQPVYI
ncbi:amyloid-beta A4 precursor protein-binding family A member 1-like [Diretmus argenteus]